MAFLDPDTPADGLTPDVPEEPELNVSGQPKARYEWWGSQNRGYLVKDPQTDEFRTYKNGKRKGWTRVTTFNKAATDSKGLSDWGKRNVLLGASLRPDIVARAHGLSHAESRKELDSLVSELETAAGAKVSADIGTMLHEYTERGDGGQLEWSEVPEQFKPTLRLYAAALKEYGLVPVCGLIERTTCVLQFGGVVGTMDRVYLHRPSGKYVIGDLKTGKTLEYGMDEIETQLAIYARGLNAWGVYDWHTDAWQDAATPDGESVYVSEDWGVVVHLPVQGDDQGTCKVVRADLQRGWRHAALCHAVREERANKPKPELFTGAELA
jgi:hypothetical protein